MIPYADFTYFGVLLYVVVPTLVLGAFGRAGWRWALFVTLVMLIIQCYGVLHIRPEFAVQEIWIVLGFAVWQWAVVRGFAGLGAPAGWLFYAAVGLSLLPLAAAKFFPVIWPGTEFGFLGISYVTFRALDLVFCLRDNVITTPGTLDLFMFMFFFPTISSGPIDRYRRFVPEWRRRRTRAEFLNDLDGAVHRLFRGFFYKFIIAALIKEYWLERAAASGHVRALLSYMYAYSLYLFFDFAGYSAAVLGYFLAFGLMGLWHGIEPHYIIYGLYQAVLLSAFHLYSNRKKAPRPARDSPWRRALAIFVTFQFVCFGLLIFSGRIGAPPAAHHLSDVEDAGCEEISGWIWDKHAPDARVNVEIWDGEECLMNLPAQEFRQDLVDAGYGDGRHGFRIATPASLHDGRSHRIHLRIAGSKRELKNSPRVLACH